VSVHVTEKTGGASFCASVSVFVFVLVLVLVLVLLLVLVLVFAFFLVVPPPCSAQSVAQAAADAAQHARHSVALLVQKNYCLLVQKILTCFNLYQRGADSLAAEEVRER
jgi:hypothetical protein